MDPVTAFGAAVGALQIVDYSIKIIQKASKLATSTAEKHSRIYEIETAAKDLVECINRFPVTSALADDHYTKAICESACHTAEQLLAAVGAIKSDAVGSKWKLASRAVRTLRGESRIGEFQARLSDLRLQLTMHLAIESKKQQDGIKAAMESMERQVTSIAEDVKSITRGGDSIQTVCDVGTLTCTLSGTTTERTAQIPAGVPETAASFDRDASTPDQMQLNVSRPSIQVQSPARFQCGDAHCPCSCHLGRYVKSPQFLRAFLGALSFRGSCPNHTTSLWEVRYWIPEWASNYNVYLLFERTACGSPVVGLKFPRKVPWGRQDTIIRFSLLGDTAGIRSMLDSRQGTLYDVDPNHGRTVLHYAVMRNRLKACRLLLDVGADRFAKDESNMSATEKAWEHIFTKRGTPAVLEAYKTLFPIDELHYWNFSPWHKTVLGISGSTLPQLLASAGPATCVDLDADVDAVDAQQRTALHWAALRGDLDAVRLLLEAQADVHAVDELHNTPLTYAASAATPRMVELLLLSRAQVNHTNHRGDSPLHYAARHRDDVASVQILVRSGAAVDRKNALGNTPLAGAAIANRTAAGRYLLSQGADRHSTNKYGDTPLQETIYHNCHAFLRMLLADGTRYDSANSHGTTLLHAVALEADLETVQILKSAGLRGLYPQLKNSKGQVAMEICQDRMGAPAGFKEAFSDLLSAVTSASAV